MKIRFIFLVLYSVVTASCIGKYDAIEEKTLIDCCYRGEFSYLLNADKNVLKKLYNTDKTSPYYIGLYLSSNKKNECIESAKEYFSYAVKYSPFPYNQLAKENLYELLSNEEKIDELKKTISDTKTGVEKKEELNDKLQTLYFLSSQFDKLDKPILDYVSEIKLNSELIKIVLKLSENSSDDFSKILKGRILVHSSSFKEAWDIFRQFIQNFNNYPYIEYRATLSDIGKAALYGSTNYKEDAALFENRLLELEEAVDFKTNNHSKKYMYAFYAARLNQRINDFSHNEKAVSLFKKAASYAISDFDYDNALWYALNILKNNSFNAFFEELCRLAPLWKNSGVYEDFVSYTCMKLTSESDWTRFHQFYTAIKATSLYSAQIRHSYIIARSNFFPEQETVNLYSQICKQNHGLFYYKIMASNLLNKPFPIESYSANILRDENKFSSSDSFLVLQGLIKYKLYSQIYKIMIKIYPQINLEQAAILSQVLLQNELYSDAMKVITFALHTRGSIITNEYLKLAYPRPWLSFVKKYANEYNLPEYLLYALLRSESYFKHDVVSHAGAVGLAQLMKPTAAGIAERLKLKIYDLNDPDTNIRFGAFYLAQMIKQNNGKILPAIFSYNAGPATVKRWIKQSNAKSDDLFLETLNYAETRGYGKNILTSSVIYALLYYDKTYNEVIDEIFSNIK